MLGLDFGSANASKPKHQFLRVIPTDGCKLGPSSIILFEKSIIFGVIIKLSEMRRLCTFQKSLRAVGEISPQKVVKPGKSDI
jgi:hypothetical protein